MEEKKLYKTEIRLNKASAVNKLLARTINGLIQGEIPEGQARAIGYLAGALLKSFETTELQQRIEALEEELKGGKS